MKFLYGTVALCVCVIAAISVVVGLSINSAVERVVMRDASDKAEHWGDYAVERIPGIEELVQTGTPTDEQRDVIRKIRAVGDIFRFKLFDANGRLSLISDDTHIMDPAGVTADEDPEPKQVAQTGRPIIEVYDGSQKPDRPDLYAEAYVPLTAADGTVLGVVEVYVDQTATRAYFLASFRTFGIMLIAFTSLVFVVPGAAFLLQRFLARKSQQTAEFLARFDPLTGVLNRRAFMDQAKNLIVDQGKAVVCYLDLDRFKQINDKYGHAAGDAFLAHVSQVLRLNCRSDDLLARFGGDEFVIVFQNIDIQSVIQKVRIILLECAKEVVIGDTRLTGSISIGLAERNAGESLDQTLSNADAALYHVKAAGRNDFAVYGCEMGEELRRRHKREARLREAAKNCDFEIHYQPLVSDMGGTVIGHEALLRLKDDDGQPISPVVFIPLAEELGLIDTIGKWTIETATRTMAASASDRMLAINLSTIQFRSGELVGIVKHALQASGFPAHQLELEITESLLLEDSPHVAMQIDTLKEMGVAIAMDDFGTGFSSLSYLWKYGFDRLKIDQSFVAALDDHPVRSREIIETVVLLGTKLGMKITAEGVENARQAELLSSLGCDVLQGHHFGMASPFNETLSATHGTPAALPKTA